MDCNLVANLQVFKGRRCTALFKLGLVTHLYRYGFLGRGFSRNRAIRNASYRAHDMLFFSMGKSHQSKREQQSNDCDGTFQFHWFLLRDCDELVVSVKDGRVALRLRIAPRPVPPASLLDPLD